MFAKQLHRGELASCLAYSNEFDSRVPARFNLPPLPTKSNLAEGVVIRPIVEPLDCSAAAGGRGLFKSKIAAFSEDARYQNATWQSARAGVAKSNKSKSKKKKGAGAGAVAAAVAFGTAPLRTSSQERLLVEGADGEEQVEEEEEQQLQAGDEAQHLCYVRSMTPTELRGCWSGCGLKLPMLPLMLLPLVVVSSCLMPVPLLTLTPSIIDHRAATPTSALSPCSASTATSRSRRAPASRTSIGSATSARSWCRSAAGRKRSRRWACRARWYLCLR